MIALPSFATMRETLEVEFIDRAGKVIASRAYSDGRPDYVVAPLRDIVATALRLDAASIALLHNHPGGIARPSVADRILTRRLAAILHPLGVRLRDHIITGAAKRYSFRAEGLI